jgi:hypothetical protein
MVILMKKIILTASIVASTLLATTTFADDATLEKCVTSKDGEPEMSVMVPAGECEKMQKGDFSGVSEEVKAEFEKAMESK